MSALPIAWVVCLAAASLAGVLGLWSGGNSRCLSPCPQTAVVSLPPVLCPLFPVSSESVDWVDVPKNRDPSPLAIDAECDERIASISAGRSLFTNAAP